MSANRMYLLPVEEVLLSTTLEKEEQLTILGNEEDGIKVYLSTSDLVYISSFSNIIPRAGTMSTLEPSKSRVSVEARTQDLWILIPIAFRLSYPDIQKIVYNWLTYRHLLNLKSFHSFKAL